MHNVTCAVYGWKFVAGKMTDFQFQVLGSWTVEDFEVEKGMVYQLGQKVAFGFAVGM
jgi:hypothetical protein